MIGVRVPSHSENRPERVTGKKGRDSAAAKYALASPPEGFSIQEDKPYAEVYWLAMSPVRVRSD
jgi:mannose-6-phosphate isomerase